MYAVMLLQHAGAAREPGWGAVLDPIFFFFAVVLLFSIGMMIRLALRRDDASSIEWGDDS